jgi:hypothetical protein
MLRVVLERLLARVPGYRITEDSTPYRHDDAAIVFALHHLPAVFTPVS